MRKGETVAVVDWMLVASLGANLLMAWQLRQQKQEFAHSRREALIGTVKTSMKALHSSELQLKVFATNQKIDPASDRGKHLQKCITETVETYNELQGILQRLVSSEKIPEDEFMVIWATVHVASSQIEELESIFDAARQVNRAHNNALQPTSGRV